ncbi:hypothetical protein JTE90_028662 [Oedothorax gibbosus]|uniref:D-aminoacyl-tRNA deacylase n=1 Tax=Oedothorax gibbosus TaxID=931172 RepID=A0AAV6UZT0_9ARAC|nr:hypothetical protein JTE90_028662 [Oedothorax gibbosus]
MRACIQRCTKASVSVNGELISSIGRGICVLIGISKDDNKKDMDFMIRKLLNIRLFEDAEGKRWVHSVKEKQYEVLLVSQFTLYCTLKGNKPDFRPAMIADASEKFYSDFVAAMKREYSEEHIKDGKFGAYMQVSIENDGPVTINIESPGKALVKEPNVLAKEENDEL